VVQSDLFQHDVGIRVPRGWLVATYLTGERINEAPRDIDIGSTGVAKE
jgi:hypothetical protein